ncbi:NPCBM/NEW2 domain-containing protein [Candidatus Sumerlaeota bacterium]|nr:NPCBM/NEW2 domain-containing protein [Candidatus Sumerlaeota bacterium]
MKQFRLFIILLFVIQTNLWAQTAVNAESSLTIQPGAKKVYAMLGQPITLDASEWAAAEGFDASAKIEWSQQIGSDETMYVEQFEGPPNDREAYGDRYTGYLYAPASGDYTFYIASDDEGELWLSTNDDPANLRRIAYTEKWTSRNQWDKFPTQKSATIPLEAGGRYRVMALHKDGDGMDHFSVAWNWDSKTTEPLIIDGRYLSAPDGQTRCLLREVWVDVAGPALKGLTDSPRYKVTEPAPIDNASSLRARSVVSMPGKNVYHLLAASGDKTSSATIVVFGIDGLREALESAGYEKLPQARQDVFLALMHEDNPVSNAARNDLRNHLESAKYASLEADAQSNSLNEFIRKPRFGQTWGPEAKTRQPYTLGEPYKIEPYKVWSGEDGPEWRRDMQIDGRVVYIDSYEKDMVQVERAANGVAGMPDPLRGFIRNIKIVSSNRNEYNGSNGLIFIRLTYVPSQENVDSTFTHEIGHTLEGRFELQDAWNEAIRQDDIAVSTYGNTNMSEDFADFTRQYTAHVFHADRTDHGLDKLYPHRFALMEKIIHSIGVGKTPEEPLTDVPAEEHSVALSLYAPQEEKVGWQEPCYNEMMGLDTAMRSGKQAHQYGIYAHAPARHVYNLDRQWKKFNVAVGLCKGHHGSVVFVIKADGEEAYRSDLINSEGETPVELDVADVEQLELLVEDGGDDASHDWGMWFSPMLSR